MSYYSVGCHQREPPGGIRKSTCITQTVPQRNEQTEGLTFDAGRVTSEASTGLHPGILDIFFNLLPIATVDNRTGGISSDT